MAKPLSLLDNSSDSEVEFTINKGYAEKYDSWRNKEELQKLKDLSKDISETSSESEEEDEPVIEKDFLKALSLIKGRDPVIYNEDVELFKEENSPKKPKVKKEKPMYMKDYERKVVLERNGKFSDDDEDEVPLPKPSMNEELNEITKSLKAAVDSDEEDEADVGGLFQVRTKTKEEEENEEEEYLQWLKGQKKKVDKKTEKDLSFLHRYWTDSNLDEGEKFLRDYLLNQKFLEKDDGIPSYQDITEEAEALREEEETLQQQEQFEQKYNFRFEEPDPEFIKRYPRTVGDSLRRVDNKRKMKREEYTERKKKEKDQMREELKRLKALKRKEIEEKFFKLKEASGKDEINFDEDDIESDFDPDKHDEKMKELFDDDYYAVEEEQKPEFIHDADIDDEDWDHWTRDQVHPKAGNSSSQPDNEEDSSEEEDQAPDRKVEFEQEMIESTRSGRKKGRKKSLFAKVISQPKPLYDPDGKSFQDYLDEYYNLDYEDVIGDLPVRFKYRKVIPNDFGLTAEEILSANDKELNRWCSVKKTCQYRRDDEEMYDVQAFQKKAQNIAAKEKILVSIYAPPEEEEDASKEGADNANKKKKRSRKKKKFQNGVANTEQDTTTQEANVDTGTSTQEEDADQSTYTQEGDAAGEDMESSDSKQNSVSKKKKKKFPIVDGNNLGTSTQEEDADQGTYSQEGDTAEEGMEGLDSKQEGMSKKKKKKKSSELPDETRNESQNNASVYENSLNSSKDNIECMDSSNAGDGVVTKKKKKKNKRKAESLDEVSSHSSELPKTKHLKSNTMNDGERDSAINNQGSSAERPGQSSSRSKKSRKRNRNKSAGKTMQMSSHSDKRLGVPDSRLAAFGINPKKYKAGIIYSKK